MQLPKNWQEVKPAYSGEHQMPAPGLYVCKIVTAEQATTRAGRPRLRIALDIADGEYADYYTNRADDAADKGLDIKWGLTLYQLTDGSSLRYFMGLMSAINDWNPSYDWQSHVNDKSELDERSLKDKQIGMLLVGEEYEYNGRVRMSLRPKKFYKTQDFMRANDDEAYIKGVDGTIRKVGDPPPEKNVDNDPDEIDIPF